MMQPILNPKLERSLTTDQPSPAYRAHDKRVSINFKGQELKGYIRRLYFFVLLTAGISHRWQSTWEFCFGQGTVEVCCWTFGGNIHWGLSPRWEDWFLSLLFGTLFSHFILSLHGKWHQFVTDQDHYCCKNNLLRCIHTVLQIFDFSDSGRILHRKLTKFWEFVTKNLVTLTSKVYFKS